MGQFALCHVVFGRLRALARSWPQRAPQWRGAGGASAEEAAPSLTRPIPVPACTLSCLSATSPAVLSVSHPSTRIVWKRAWDPLQDTWRRKDPSWRKAGVSILGDQTLFRTCADAWKVDSESRTGKPENLSLKMFFFCSPPAPTHWHIGWSPHPPDQPANHLGGCRAHLVFPL